MIQDCLSVQIESNYSTFDHQLLPNQVLVNQFNKVAIAEVSIPISFFSIPQDTGFEILVDPVVYPIAIESGSPTLSEFIDALNIQMTELGISILVRENSEKGYIDFVSTIYEDFIIQIYDPDVYKYLGFPEAETFPEPITYGYSSSQIVDFVSHQILNLSSNMFQNTLFNSWVTINTTTAPQFSVFTQQYEMLSTMKDYNQSQRFQLSLKTQDGEDVVFQNQVKWMMRIVFINYQEYPIDLFVKMGKDIAMMLQNQIDQQKQNEEEKKISIVNQLKQIEDEISGFINF